jgi:hypothetical protein
MAVPTTRNEFKQYCLRKLGAPVIEINVDDDQVDDRIDEALRYYWDYHFDGSEKIYYKHQVTAQDMVNKYITMPDNVIGAISVFSLGDPSVRADDLFNIRYQIALNDLYSLTSVSMIPYFMVMEHLSLISEMLVGKIPIRYNRIKNLVYLDMDWNAQVKIGEYLLIEAYEVVDPVVYSGVWAERWLQNYATAKIKYQWGSNLTKFVDMQLPGGVRFNGQQILKDAEQEIAKMEDEMINSFSLPVSHMVG